MKKRHYIWLQEFLANCSNLNRSQNTLENYKRDLLRFICWYEEHYPTHLNKANAATINAYKKHLNGGGILSMRPMQITPNAWQRLIKNFQNLFSRASSDNVKIRPQKSHFAPLTINSQRRHLSSIKNFYEFLVQSHEDINKLFANNPVKSKLHTIRVKQTDVHNTKYLTHDDWEKIAEYCWRPKEALIVHLLYYGGLRVSELCQLKVSDFNWENATLNFSRKGGYKHTLKINQHRLIFDLFHRHQLKQNNENEFVFMGRGNQAITSRAMHEKLINIFKRCDCKTQSLTPHSFRKACATNIYYETKDLLYVRDYLNHSDAKVTQTYIEVRREFEENHPH